MKKMIQRCPNCGQWMETTRSGIWGRAISGWAEGAAACGEVGKKVGDKVGLKNIGEFIGDYVGGYGGVLTGIDNALSGEKYQFQCVSCGAKWSTNNEEDDQTSEYELWLSEKEVVHQLKEVWVNAEDQKGYEAIVASASDLADKLIFSEFKSTAYDLLALGSYMSGMPVSETIKAVDNSLKLIDDPELHAIKALAVSKELDSMETDIYQVIREMNIFMESNNEPSYFKKSLYEEKFTELENRLVHEFEHIQPKDRKFITFVDNVNYCPENIIPIPFRSIPENLIFPDGDPQKGVLYIENPIKPNIYYRSDRYEIDVFRDQLEDLLLLLNSLGAKSIFFSDSRKDSKYKDNARKTDINAGGSYEEYSGGVNVDASKQSASYKQLCNEYFREQHLDVGIFPREPENCSWYPYMKDWQNLAYQRLQIRTALKDYRKISAKSWTEIQSDKQVEVNAEFNALIARANTNVGLSTKDCFNASNEICWEYQVEFYPYSAYRKMRGILSWLKRLFNR